MNPFPEQAPYYAPPSPSSPVRFAWLGEAWRLFTARLWLWLGVMLILLTLSAAGMVAMALAISVAHPSSTSGDASFDWSVVLGGDILIGAAYLLVLFLFSGGVFRIALRQARGEPVGIEDLFRGGARFWPLAGFWALSGAAVGIGLGLCLIPGLVLAALLLPAPALIADGDGVFRAVGRSLAAMQRGWLTAIGLMLLMSGLLALGLLPCGLGLFVTQPLLWLLTAVAALEMTGPHTHHAASYLLLAGRRLAAAADAQSPSPTPAAAPGVRMRAGKTASDREPIPREGTRL